MSVKDVRSLLQQAVKRHRLVFDYWGKPVGCDCSLDEDMTEAEHVKHFTDVLMNLHGLTITLRAAVAGTDQETRND